MKAYNLEFSGIDMSDAPDFCDAYITYAEHENGEPLNENELDELNYDVDFIYNAVIKHIY